MIFLFVVCFVGQAWRKKTNAFDFVKTIVNEDSNDTDNESDDDNNDDHDDDDDNETEDDDNNNDDNDNQLDLNAQANNKQLKKGGKDKKKKKNKKKQNDESVAAPKVRRRSGAEVYNQILWDEHVNTADYTIVWEDRFIGDVRQPVTEFDSSTIPFHRVRRFERGDVVVWCRATGVDTLRKNK